MALVRLAKLDDYESVEVLGRTMFKITWCPNLCPGSPTDNPAIGLNLFNEYQCSVAAGLESRSDPADKLAVIVDWCLTTACDDRVPLARVLVKAKREGVRVGLDINDQDYTEPALGYRYELAFLNDEIQQLAAAQVMQLQNLLQVAQND